MLWTLRHAEVLREISECQVFFKERLQTKRNARQSSLTNAHFSKLLDILVSPNEPEIVSATAAEYIHMCLREKMISRTALVALMQHRLPIAKTPKKLSIPVFQKISAFSFKAGDEFCLEMCASEPRLIPMVVQFFIGSTQLKSDFVSFVLGDSSTCPEFNVSGDAHYREGRSLLLHWLLGRLSDEDSAELVYFYFVWNASRGCLFEFASFSDLIDFFLQDPSKINHGIWHHLFRAYVETVCDSYNRYGSLSVELGRLVSFLGYDWVDDEIAFLFIALMLNCKNIDIQLCCDIINTLLIRPKLLNYLKVACAKLLFTSQLRFDKSELLKKMFEMPVLTFTCSFSESPGNYDYITEFGCVSKLCSSSKVVKSKVYRNLCFYSSMAQMLPNIEDEDLTDYVKAGYFEEMFTILHVSWGHFREKQVLLKQFLQLLVPIENEPIDSKTLRYSWVVGAFEASLDLNHFTLFLPHLCSFVTESDNVLFSFVQQKISSLYMRLGDFKSSQLSVFCSLLTLFDSSQSRQSRLNFLASLALSFFSDIVKGCIPSVDSRAVYLGLKLLSKLVAVSVLDPRTIWTKYISACLLLQENANVKAGVALFAGSLAVIKDDNSGLIDGIKREVVDWLLSRLDVELDGFVFDHVIDSLSEFNVEVLKLVSVDSYLKLRTSERSQEDGEEEIKFEKIKELFTIFNPSELYELYSRFSGSHSLRNWKRLWAKLIDHEVSHLPRSKFLGSVEVKGPTAASKPRHSIATHPTFCTQLLHEEFDNVKISDVDEAIGCIKSRFCPVIPSISSLIWYVRPHLSKFLQEATARLFSKIDDRRIFAKLSDWNFLLNSLKSSSTPQSASNLIISISSIVSYTVSFQLMSLEALRDGWIKCLTSPEKNEYFKSFSANEEFLASLYISASMFASQSPDIDEVLSKWLNDGVFQNPRMRDGISTFSAIESSVVLNSSIAEGLVLNTGVSFRQRLCAALALKRSCAGCASIANRLSKSAGDDSSQVLLMILSNGSSSSTQAPQFSEPLEFKGLALFIQSMFDSQGLINSSKAKALQLGNIPASLKFDAVLGYLLGNGLNLYDLTFDATFSLSEIEASTSDSKCLAFIQTLKYFETGSKCTESLVASCDTLNLKQRLGQNSYLALVCEEWNATDKYATLSLCHVLPRIQWDSVPFSCFSFVLKHVVSETPITRVPYVNLSLLKAFKSHVLQYAISTLGKESDLKRVLEIILIYLEGGERILLLENLFTEAISLQKFAFVQRIFKTCVDFDASIVGLSLKPFEDISSNELILIADELLMFLSHFKLPWSFAQYLKKQSDDCRGVFHSLLLLPVDVRLHWTEVYAKSMQTCAFKDKMKVLVESFDVLILNPESAELVSHFVSILFVDNHVFKLLLRENLENASPIEIEKLQSRLSSIPENLSVLIEDVISSIEWDNQYF